MPSRVYHIDVTPEQVEGARIAILPGDPARVPLIAQMAPLTNARLIANKREYHSWLGYIGPVPIVVASTGIGGPSTSIAIDELAKLGIDTFLRVGTTGAIQPQIAVGDVVITTGAVRLEIRIRRWLHVRNAVVPAKCLAQSAEVQKKLPVRDARAAAAAVELAWALRQSPATTATLWVGGNARPVEGADKWVKSLSH
jgi:uridine phosphorylase